MRKYIAALILLCIVPVFLCADVRYLSDEEYKDLSKQERLTYWDELQNELTQWQTRQADATEAIPQRQARIEALKGDIAATQQEYDVLYNQILESLGGITRSEIVDYQKKIDEMESELAYYEQIPNSELYKSNKEIKEFIANYEAMKQERVAKAPDFCPIFKEMDQRIATLTADLDAARPKYYEDTHVVVKGEYLSKIAGYAHIYNDPAKWGIIYRANRDQIKDPDLIYPDQVFKIPRGLPTSWKVYRGECLWTIASYPEVYNDPFKWPVIYRANTDQIKDPDLIYPNQVLRIPRD